MGPRRPTCSSSTRRRWWASRRTLGRRFAVRRIRRCGWGWSSSTAAPPTRSSPPDTLARCAVMGDAYVRTVLGVARPRVALLSNGEEETKGTELTRQAAALLRSSDLRFVGYVEGKDIFSGVVDVVVTDGFTGNVVLKTAEGTAMGIVGMIKEAIDAARLPERLGALLLKPTLLGLKKVVDYAEYGGAPLLGTDGVSIVAHGRSDARAIASALAAALATREHRLTESIRAAIHRSSAWLPTRSVKKGKGTAAESVPD